MKSDTAADATDPMPRVEGFTLTRRIGSGGYSTVYEATQEDVAAPVALKVLRIAYDARARTRFERECRSLGRLRGTRGIVSVYNATYTEDGRPVIVMSLFSGGSLADRIKGDGPLPADDILTIAHDIGGALAVAHEAGIVHRDIKPENILLDRFGRAALADFGIATLAGEVESTETAASLTPAHAPPERYLADDVARDPVRGDIYSLASTLSTLITGRAPHGSARDGGIAALIQRILNEPPTPIARADLPDSFLAAITRAMAKDPADRFASVTEFLAAIEPSTPPAPEPEPDDADPERTRRRPTAAEVEAARRGIVTGDESVPTPEPIPSPEQSPDDEVLPGHGRRTPRRGRRGWIIGGAAVAIAAASAAVVFGTTSAGTPACVTGPQVPTTAQMKVVHFGTSESDGYFFSAGDSLLPITKDVGIQVVATGVEFTPEADTPAPPEAPTFPDGTLFRVGNRAQVWQLDGQFLRRVQNACSADVYRLPDVPDIFRDLGVIGGT